MTIRPQFGFIMEYVDDLAEARHFYADVLGLTVAREHPQFIEFRDARGVSFGVATDEPLSGGDEPEIYWRVDDAEAAFKELSPRAEVTMPLRQMPYGTLFALKDPAGRPCFLIEFAENWPSREVG